MTNDQLQEPAFLEELAEIYAEPDFRANVPAGTEIGHQSPEPGAEMTWKKSASKMRIGNRVLPERIPLYNLWNHDLSMVPPTIANKRMSEHPGQYSMRKPANWDATARQPIDETCEICARRRIQETGPGTPPKPFFDRAELRNHMRYMHTNEWEAIEQTRRDDERRGDQSRMETLIASIAAMVRPGVQLPPEVEAQIQGLQQDDPEPKRSRR